MPLAREAKIPLNRLVLNRVLKTLNVVVIVSGALIILMVLYIQQIPTFCPGWLLIFLGGLVITGGLSGFGGTTLPCCYITHVVTMACSGFGVLVFSLVLFGERAKVVTSFESPKYTDVQVDSILMHCSWAYLVLSGLQICCIIGRSILQKMTSDAFQTFEQTRDNRNITMSQMCRDVGEQHERVDRTAANKVEEKMASKYGEWMK
ncbi:unnamed protein product [Calypogeia fissa]